MKLLKDIEKGILEGNWDIVVKAYNKITGKNLEVPDLFNPKTANKRELYKYLTTKMSKSLQPIKEYTIEELRDLITFFGNETNDAEEQITNELNDVVEDLETDSEESYIFITNPDAEIPENLKHLRPTKLPHLEFGDEKKIDKQYRPPVKLIKAECKKCHQMVEMKRDFVIKSPNGGYHCVCEQCQDAR